MLLVGVINGGKLVQDYELSAGSSALLDEGIKKGTLGMSFSETEHTLTLQPGVAFVKVRRGVEEFFIDIHNMEEQTFSAGDGDYLWIVVDQAKIDDPSQVDESGSNVASFKVGLHPPLSENVLVLGQCKYDVETETSYVEVITKEISNIEDMFVQEANSGSPYQGISSGTGNNYYANYATEVIAKNPSDPSSIGGGEMYLTLDRTITGSVLLTIPTTAGNLTRELKIGNRSLTGGELTEKQTISFVYSKLLDCFQLMSPLTNYQSTETNSVIIVAQAGEEIHSGDAVCLSKGRRLYGYMGVNEQFRGNQTESGFGQNADNLTIYTKLDIPNDIPDNSFISSLNVGIRKQGAPTDNYVLTVYDEADLNTAIFSISKGGADLTTTNTKTLLGTNIPVQAGHTYRFVFSRSSGTADGTNYYVLGGVIYEKNGAPYLYNNANVKQNTSILANFIFSKKIQEGFAQLSIGKNYDEVIGVAVNDADKLDLLSININGQYGGYDYLPAGQNIVNLNRIVGNYQVNQSTRQNFGYSLSDRQMVAYPLLMNSDTYLEALTIGLCKVGVPIDNFIFQIVPDNGGSPDSDIVLAEHIINGEMLRTDLLYYDLDFNVELEGLKLYRLVCSRSGSMDTANYARTLIYSNAAASYVGGKEKVYSNQNWLINNNNVLQFNMICKEEFMKNYYTTAGDTEYSFGVNDQDRSKISQSYCFGTEINLRKFVFSGKVNTPGNVGDCVVSVCPVIQVDKLGYDNMKYNGSNSNISVGNTDTQKKVAQCFQADMNISSDTVNIGCLVSGSPQYALKVSICSDNGGIPGSVLATGSITNSVMLMNTGQINRLLKLNTAVSYVVNQKYRIVVEKDGPSDSGFYNIRYQNSKQRTDFKVYDGTTGTRGGSQNYTMQYIIGDTLDNTFYKPDYDNKFAQKTIPQSAFTTGRMPIDVDFGKDVIIPAGTEFAIVREKSINSQTNPTYSVLCTNSKTGFVKGNISFFQNGSWLWSYNRNAFVNVGFVYKMEKYNQLKGFTVSGYTDEEMVNNKVFGKIIDANSIVVDIGEGKTDNYIGGTGIALWSGNIYTCLSGCYSGTDPMTGGWTGAVQVGTIINLRSSLDGVITLTFTGASGKADNAGRYKLNGGNVISVSGATNITVKKGDILTFQGQSHCEGGCCTSHNGNVTVNVTTSQYSSLSFTPV